MSRLPRPIARVLGRLWPASLTGRVLLILIAGMLAAQALTGTIWWDLRRGQLLEVPLRVAAARAVDSLQLLASLPAEAREAAVHTLSADNYRLQLLDDTQARAQTEDGVDASSARLVADVMSQRVGSPVPVRLLRAELRGDDGEDDSTYALLTAHDPVTRVSLLLPLAANQWLRIDAREGESGYPVRPFDALADYVVRIYVLRILLVAAVALVAVRLAMRPLARMARAADAFGRDLASPPMATDGPTEVRQAALAFNAMQRRIAEGVAERTRFLAAVSHDLRSPITRLRLRAETLQPPEIRDKVRADLAEMEAMVAGTLDMLRGVEGQGERQPVDMNSLLRGLALDQEDAHGVEVPVSGSASRPLPGYAQSLRRCFGNLLENAHRYARGARVVIEEDAQADAQVQGKGQVLRITVRDDGPGIPPEHLAQVTEPFYRVDAARSADAQGGGGVGLGLSIAETVARAHGGALRLVNRDGGGLDVIVELPRS